MDFHDYAHDLRLLADILDATAADLPLPMYANQGLTIGIHTAEAIDVVAAAKALGTEVKIRNGHTTTAVDIDTVCVEFIHVDVDAMARYNLRQAYAKTMPAKSVSS